MIASGSNLGDQNYVVGAYPASPAHKVWDPAKEMQLFDLLSSDERVAALEIPWLGSIHPHDNSWLIDNFPRNLQAIITSIPYVMSKVGKDSNYGLASANELGRAEALEDVRNIFRAIDNFNNTAGQSMVSAVEIHTAPRQFGDENALAKSLKDIASWNWGNTKIVIEHCDAWVEGQSPEKGFLTLEKELTAIDLSAAPIGIFINWGRSAIELRDAHRVAEHIVQAKSLGLLSGVIFSGVADVESDFGYPWIDAHLPFHKSDTFAFGDSHSLLTTKSVNDALDAAGKVEFLGIKMGWSPKLEGDVNQRYQMISQALDILNSCNR
ncbi:MAG: DUF4862 family protein [Candidatus Nanopelagicaceae bacterium]|nr:DUF4862 family protein [Candidatus Nanopelagicaceae bacterium]